MRVTSSSLAIALLLALFTLQVSCANKVTVHFDEKTNVGIGAAFNSASKEIEITLDTTHSSYKTTFEASAFLNNAVWLPEDSAWMKTTSRSGDYQVYALNFAKVLSESEKTDSDTPCGLVALTKDVLCNFRIVQSSVAYPIWLKIENRDSAEPTINILGGAYNNSLTHFYAKDGTYTNKSLENESFYLQYENSAKVSLPERKLILKYADTKSIEILKAVRPAFIHFICPNFKRLSLFELDTALKMETQVNLAKLGLPFDANYSCDSTLIFTEFNNNASLVPLKASIKVDVKANETYLEWELSFPEVTSYRYNFTKMSESIAGLTEGLKGAKAEAKTDLVNFMMMIQTKSAETKANVTENFEKVQAGMMAMKGNLTEGFERVQTGMLAMKANVTENFVKVQTGLLAMKENVTENFLKVQTGMLTMKTNVTDNFLGVKAKMEEMRDKMLEMKGKMEDMRSLIIVLFVFSGLLTLGLLILGFVVMKGMKNGGNYSNDVEINSSPYVKS